MGTVPVSAGALVERRTFFQWLTYGVSAKAVAAAGIPLVGYFSAVPGSEVGLWVDLGPVDRFPINETRRKDFDNPLRVPWDGVTALTGVYVRNLGLDQKGNSQFLVFAVNCAHWAALFRGSRSPDYSCALVMAAFTTPTATGRRGRLPAACIAAIGGCATAGWRSRRHITRLCKTLW